MPFRFPPLSSFLEIPENQSSGTIFILGCSGPASSSTLSSTHLERKNRNAWTVYKLYQCMPRLKWCVYEMICQTVKAKIIKKLISTDAVLATQVNTCKF